MISAIILDEMKRAGDDEFAKHHQRFFRTGKGEYGEGDKFLGLRVPKVRAIIAKYLKSLTLADIDLMLKSEWHEMRHGAVIAMTKLAGRQPDEMYRLFLNNLAGINNWDLVDLASPAVAGSYWYKKGDYATLWEFADSGNLWKERIAVVSTAYMIRKHADCALTYRLAEHFIKHKHDLIHKAAGWMLREAGKKDEAGLKSFLDKYVSMMPRTMLRYSIEKLGAQERAKYLSKTH